MLGNFSIKGNAKILEKVTFHGFQTKPLKYLEILQKLLFLKVFGGCTKI